MTETVAISSAFDDLATQSRLVNILHNGAVNKQGDLGCRGQLALDFLPRVADEPLTPSSVCDQLMATSKAGTSTLNFLTGYLLSFGYIEQLVDILYDYLAEDGKYILFCNNIDLSKKYLVDYRGYEFLVYPIDESTVYNEILELLSIEKQDLKKMDTGEKLGAIAAAALEFSPRRLEKITFAEGVEHMGPVRNPYENRPV